MPSAKSVGNLEGIDNDYGSTFKVKRDTHMNTFTFGMGGKRSYDAVLYESLKYEDRLIFDQYDLLCIYTKTRPNVDIKVVEGRLQRNYEAALEINVTNELEKMESRVCY